MNGRTEAARKAWDTRRGMAAFEKAHAAEAASKKALTRYCAEHGWRLAFFEGSTGAPRTGIIDAVAVRLAKHNADELHLRLIQLKGGNAGACGREIARLKEAARAVTVSWSVAEFDGERLHVMAEDALDSTS